MANVRDLAMSLFSEMRDFGKLTHTKSNELL